MDLPEVSAGIVAEADGARLRALMQAHHYPGALRPVGGTVRPASPVTATAGWPSRCSRPRRPGAGARPLDRPGPRPPVRPPASRPGQLPVPGPARRAAQPRPARPVAGRPARRPGPGGPLRPRDPAAGDLRGSGPPARDRLPRREPGRGRAHAGLRPPRTGPRRQRMSGAGVPARAVPRGAVPAPRLPPRSPAAAWSARDGIGRRTHGDPARLPEGHRRPPPEGGAAARAAPGAGPGDGGGARRHARPQGGQGMGRRPQALRAGRFRVRFRNGRHGRPGGWTVRDILVRAGRPMAAAAPRPRPAAGRCAARWTATAAGPVSPASSTTGRRRRRARKNRSGPG